MSNLLQGVNLYLIGMMGAGKSTIGRLLAKELGYGFVDTDDVIVNAVGKSINQVFADEGEAEFRKLESNVLDFRLKEERSPERGTAKKSKDACKNRHPHSGK